MTAVAAKIPTTYTKNGVLYIRELSDSDETFDLGRLRAGKPIKCHGAFCIDGQISLSGTWHRCEVCKGKGTVPASVVITSMRGGKEYPVMEFESNGKFNEILATRMRTMIGQRMVEKVFELSVQQTEETKPMSKRRTRDLAVNMGLLLWYEGMGGKV